MDGGSTTPLAREVTATAVSELDALIRRPGAWPRPEQSDQCVCRRSSPYRHLVSPIHRQRSPLRLFASLPPAGAPSAGGLVLLPLST